MLAEHLTSEHDLASRWAETIERHVAFIHHTVLGERPARVLDLACGPGLCLHRLARLGRDCLGINFSPASIEHARQVADDERLRCRFVLQDLRDGGFGEDFHLVMLIFGQLNVFRRHHARKLLERAWRALKPSGLLLLEPQPWELVRREGEADASWYTAEAGLFGDAPHVVLYEWSWDEARRTGTERFHAIDAATGRVQRYALSNEAYATDELKGLLEDIGFGHVTVYPSLSGEADDPLYDLVLTARG